MLKQGGPRGKASPTGIGFTWVLSSDLPILFIDDYRYVLW